MKRIVSGLLAALLMLAGMARAAGLYRTEEGNADNFAALLTDLVKAYETPEETDADRIDADLQAVRAVSEADYEIAASIAEHWRAVYLDPGYGLFMYGGGERATELEAAGLQVGDAHAIVVLGYELKNGEMTPELTGRCDAAAALARSWPNAIIVCSGGATGDNNPHGHTEAGLMKAYLTQVCGIDGARIHIDERAQTTVDNAVNTYRIMRDQGMRTMTIVTSSYHQLWGQVIYNAVGAIIRQRFDYWAPIVGNYCFETEPTQEIYRRGDRIAARQLGQLLNLPKEALSAPGR